LNIDGGRIGTKEQLQGGNRQIGDGNIYGTIKKTDDGYEQNFQGRWPSNIILSHPPDCVCINEKIYACVPDCPVRIMDGQSGEMKSHYPGKAIGTKHNENVGGSTFRSRGLLNYHSDSGGASRFFYCAKAKRSEREAGLREFIECVKCGKTDSKTHTIKGIKENCIRNNHPTVKPLNLMRYLLTLIKMPNENQVILDPFCGSGSTLVAAEQLGINYIGIDQDFDNILISTARIG
jgi:site-specific DNA-methyltransferase (adenine-specific)